MNTPLMIFTMKSHDTPLLSLEFSGLALCHLQSPSRITFTFCTGMEGSVTTESEIRLNVMW